MNSKVVVIILIQCFRIRALSFTDVCDTNDIYCLRQNINGIGNIKFGKCYTRNVLRRIEGTTLLDCIKECFKTSNCTSVSLRSGWNICDINNGDPLEGESTEEPGCTFSNLSDWPESIGGECYGHDCAEGQRCTGKNSDDTYQCEESYCKAMPCAQNAIVIEKFGMYRNIGQGVKYDCMEGYKVIGRPFTVCETSGYWNSMFACLPVSVAVVSPLKPVDCSDMIGNPSGLYRIYTAGDLGFNVYCDMDTDGGGWTVFQRRLDGSTDFYRNWLAYENGFGCLEHEFWFGNKYLSILTATGSYQLRVDMMDTSGEKRYAEYNYFKINDADQKYSLEISSYSGNAGDSLSYHNGQNFSTKDQDNDANSINCAVKYKGAWWYNRCHFSNLNGLYLNGSHAEFAIGTNWFDWKGYKYSLMRTKMMIRKRLT